MGKITLYDEDWGKAVNYIDPKAHQKFKDIYIKMIGLEGQSEEENIWNFVFGVPISKKEAEQIPPIFYTKSLFGLLVSETLNSNYEVFIGEPDILGVIEKSEDTAYVLFKSIAKFANNNFEETEVSVLKKHKNRWVINMDESISALSLSLGLIRDNDLAQYLRT